MTRSQSVLYEKSQCIIYQKIGGQLHKVEMKETGQKMLEVSQKLPDNGMYRRLNFTVCPGDTLANDVLYYNLCWATIKKKAEAPQKTLYSSEEIIYTALSEIELMINLIELELNDPSYQILDMNKVNITSCNLLFENGVKINEIHENYEKQLKTPIQENIPCTKFVKSKCANQSEKFFPEEAQREAMHKSSIDQTQDINLN